MLAAMSLQTAEVITPIALLLFIAPQLLSAIRVSFRLAANKDATGFTGRFHFYKLDCITGRVLGGQLYSETYGGGSIQGSTTTGVVTGSSYVRTDTTHSLRLLLADGAQTDIDLVNFGVTARPDDVISVWFVRRGHKRFPIAVINNTTRAQNVNSQQLFKILQPHQTLFLLWVVLTAIPIFAIGVFAAGIPIALWFAWGLWYFLAQRHTRKRFLRKGIQPILERSAYDAGFLH